jgi:hypothetical protein
MFKDHPNLSKIEFIVVPLAREVFESVDDIPQDVHKLMARFAPGEPMTQGLNFDFRLLIGSCDDP